MNPKFFGAKTLYLIEVSESKRKKEISKSNFHLLEERIVLIKARNFNEAIRKGEREAIAYESTHVNPFGDKVICRYLGCIDIFEIYTSPEDLAEIYSINYLVDKKINRKQILDQHFGKNINRNREKIIRQKFLNSDFNVLNKRP